LSSDVMVLQPNEALNSVHKMCIVMSKML